MKTILLLSMIALVSCNKMVIAPPVATNNGVLKYTINEKSEARYVQHQASAQLKPIIGGTAFSLEGKKPGESFTLNVWWSGGLSYGVFCGTSDRLQNWVVYETNGKVYKAKEYNGQVTRYSNNTMDVWFNAKLETAEGEGMVVKGNAVEVRVK